MSDATHSLSSMTYGGHARAILILGLPLIGGHLGQMAIGITDTVMLGWYSLDALAAITLGATFFHIFFLMGSGFAWAVMPMVAAFSAQGDDTGVRRATRMGTWLSMVFAALCLPLMIFAEPILLALRQDPSVSADAAAYLKIAGWGIFPALGIMVIKSYLSALERTQVVFWMVVVSAIANAVFNYALIFGNFGAPELGLQGAAYASILTQFVNLIGVVIYARIALPEHDIFSRMWKVDREMLWKVFRLGVPIGLTTLFEAGLFTATALMMGALGKLTLAAHGVVVSVAAVTFMVHLGISNAATVRSGNAFGRGERDHLARGARVAYLMSFVFACLTIIAYLAVPEPIISLFLDADDARRDEIIAIGVTLMAIAALFQLVDGAQVIALGVLRGVQDTTVPMIYAVISYWGIGLSCSWVLGFTWGWGGVGVWLGLVVGLLCAAVTLSYRLWTRAIPSLGTA